MDLSKRRCGKISHHLPFQAHIFDDRGAVHCKCIRPSERVFPNAKFKWPSAIKGLGPQWAANKWLRNREDV